MDSSPYQSRVNKRPSESVDISRLKKRSSECVSIEDDGVERVYKFRVLCPNGLTLSLKIRDPGPQMPIQDFVDKVKQEYYRALRNRESPKLKRGIVWKSEDLCIVDANENRFKKSFNFDKFQINKLYILRLLDGSREADTYENMWDLTPDTDLLKELPEEYSFETALADLIDNSLQAVWSNGSKRRRLVSVGIREDRISVFDSGPGMDGSEENSISKWGKMGASLHRSSRGQAIGGTPPYLMPFFGMYGSGGSIASMHLGRRALVSSKTRESKKVYMLYLEREALLSNSASKQTWRTDGGLRDPTDEELEISPGGSFTKVEIFELKMRSLEIAQLQCRIKDIYFPYIQCDELSRTGRTIMPIEFQVNGIDLAEIQGGEVATTNLHSCNGPEFVLQLVFHSSQDSVAAKSPRSRTAQPANARLKCVYLPIVEGKESIERILERLDKEGCGISENFESFSRVSIRRLGRLLPDARWAWLPFMDLRHRKGDRAQILKRCCLRVKCFIETDAGFDPTSSKTDLAHHHPYAAALKNFGNKPLEKERDVHVEIYKAEKALTLSQLEKQYQDWILQMHDRYDEEIGSGVDEPIVVLSPSNKKGLGISSDVLRVHKVIRRKGASWKSGQKIEVLKGACAGCHKSNTYATLEYFLLEGFQGDAGGESRLVCRPLGIPGEKGCLLSNHDGNPRIDIRDSISLPISVIDSGKCLAVDAAKWNDQLEKRRQKTPSSIDLLSAKHCQELKIEGELPLGKVDAGHVPPKEIVAVIRPRSFSDTSTPKNLDQKYIIRENLEMTLDIKCRAGNMSVHDQHIFSTRITPSTRNGIHGLYIFPLRCKLPQFQRAGVYEFSFSLREPSCRCVKRVTVKALSDAARWAIVRDVQNAHCRVRVGSCLAPFSIASYDRFENHIPFTRIPELLVKISSSTCDLVHKHRMNVVISANKLALNVNDLMIESNDLDKLRPRYEATLAICSKDELLSVAIPTQFLPGSLRCVIAQPEDYGKQFLPGYLVKELVLGMFDAYGNHVKEDSEVLVNVDGLCFQDKLGQNRKVDACGCVDLSGILKVTNGYGRNVSISVLSGKKEVFKEEFHIEKRVLRAASKVPRVCASGSQLENIVFEIIDCNGHVDATINNDEKFGQSHFLVIKSESSETDDSVRYSFSNGRCIVRAIPIPQYEGIFSFVAAHSRYPELQLTIEVNVEEAPKVLMLHDLPAFNNLTMEHDDVQYQSPDGRVLLLQDSPAENIENFVGSIMNDQKELEEDFLKCGTCIGLHEKNIILLHDQQVAIEQDISSLKASMDLENCSYLFEIEEMKERIESKGDSAASVVCNLLRATSLQKQTNEFVKHVIGVVALLGTVQNNELSRILADYLGDDQLLAIVCKSYAAAGDLQKYEHAFYQLATEQGKSIEGRYLVICLEDISPYTGKLSGDSQRKLALCNPTLPNGKTPPGYIGYAVNMIDLEIRHLPMTAGGRGLRETLYYHLLGELQVYESKDYMKMALPYIKHGAVSLDGGIMRGNGAIFLGRREADIHFPVVTTRGQIRISPQGTEIWRQIKAKKLELRGILAGQEEEAKMLQKYTKKFQKKRDRYSRFIDKNSPLLLGLERKGNNIDGLYNPPC